MKFEIIVPLHPPSTNKIWQKKKGGGFFKHPEYQAWENCVTAHIWRKGELGHWRTFKGRPYKLLIEVFAQTWLTSKGTIKRPDVTNFVKSAEDSICRVFGWDDAFCVECLVRKVPKPDCEADHTRIVFEFL